MNVEQISGIQYEIQYQISIPNDSGGNTMPTICFVIVNNIQNVSKFEIKLVLTFSLDQKLGKQPTKLTNKHYDIMIYVPI